MKKIYSHLNKTAFWVSLTLSVALIITSFFLPPMGVVSPSVLQAVGEIFAFAVLGTVISAIDKGSDITLNKGDLNLTLNNPDPEKQE